VEILSGRVVAETVYCSKKKFEDYVTCGLIIVGCIMGRSAEKVVTDLQ